MAPSADGPRLHLPPLDGVRAIQRALNDADLPNVVGGSGLLASLGLVDQVHDWDVVVDGDSEAVEDVLNGLGLPYRLKPPSFGAFRTQAPFAVDARDHEIDVLARFALDSPSGVVSIPAEPGGTWNGLIMGRAEDWEVVYRLLGRHDRAEALGRHLAATDIGR